MTLKRFNKGLGLVAIALLFGIVSTHSVSRAGGHIQPVGKTEEQASQLILWYDSDNSCDSQSPDRQSALQITNAGPDDVLLHIQIFRSSNANCGNSGTAVICDEKDFTDTFTPGDTHVYAFSNLGSPAELVFNVGCPDSVTQDGCTVIPIGVQDTKGFMVVTPINNVTDKTAISYQHMFGTTFMADLQNDPAAYKINAMGRDAVSFATGEVVPKGTLLNGVSNGFVLIQPNLLKFNFAGGTETTFDNFADIVGIMFTDDYTLGDTVEYRARKTANATFFPSIFNEDETPISCGEFTKTCFFDIGLNDFSGMSSVGNIQANNLLGNQLLCDDVDILRGWLQMPVDGVSGFENLIGIAGFVTDVDGLLSNAGGADWMYVE